MDDDLLTTFARHLGVPRDELDRARALAGIVIDELRRELPDVDARALEDELAVPRLVSRSPAMNGDLVARVAARSHVRVGQAKEQIESVVRALGELLSAESRLRLSKHLPPSLAPLLSPIESAPPPIAHRAPPEVTRPRTTLSSGRAGSEHPLAESRPERAHRHSIAREEGAHPDTKLSSARGTTQERLHETIADGEPPRPRRTLSR
jgi:hypothetical protein